MKGQSTVEFLTATLLFLIAITGSLTVMSDRIPEFNDDVEKSSVNVEMHRFTDRILSEPGRHSFSGGGSNWEENTSTRENIEEFGLATDYRVVDKGKIDNITTIGSNKLNYSRFREVNDLENQYYFSFTWFPVVETSSSFTRTRPPSKPSIVEPSGISADYDLAENRVHYGSIEMLGDQYNFLLAAFDGVYNTTYVSEGNWNFDDSEPQGIGDNITIENREFAVEQIQNRDRRPGSSVVLRRNIKSFGPNPANSDGEVTKLNRYAVMDAPGTDDEVVRIEVLSW